MSLKKSSFYDTFVVVVYLINSIIHLTVTLFSRLLMFTRQSSSRLSHPPESAHSDEHKLRYWCPDRQWYHSLVCGSVVQASRLLLGKLNQLRFEGKARWDNLFEEGGQVWRRADGRGLLANGKEAFDVPLKDIEAWVNNLLPSRQFGHLVLSTTFGIMDHEEARRKRTGGKILGFFY